MVSTNVNTPSDGVDSSATRLQHDVEKMDLNGKKPEQQQDEDDDDEEEDDTPANGGGNAGVFGAFTRFKRCRAKQNFATADAKKKKKKKKCEGSFGIEPCKNPC